MNIIWLYYSRQHILMLTIHVLYFSTNPLELVFISCCRWWTVGSNYFDTIIGWNICCWCCYLGNMVNVMSEYMQLIAIIDVYYLIHFHFSIIMKYRKRSEHKVLDQESHETEQQPSSTGPVVNNTTGIKNSFSLHKIEDPQVMILPRDMPLKKQSSTLPTVFNREGGQLRNGGQPESRPSGIKFGSHRFNIEAIRQQNNCEREDGEMTHKNSVVVSPNLAYNRVTSLKENSRQLRDSECQQNRQNGPRSNVRQMSGDHSYDYPQMGLGAGYWRAGKRRSNGPLSTYDSIATVTNTSYSVGNK